MHYKFFITSYLSFLVRLYALLYVWYLEFTSSERVIILTPGKVGSSSVYYSLSKNSKAAVYHLHVLNPNKIKESFLKAKEMKISIPWHLYVSDVLINQMTRFKKSTKIICIIREPISRMTSSYFQNIERYDNNEYSIDKAMKTISNHFMDSVSYYENWFHNELYLNYGIDVYSLNEENGLFKHTEDGLIFYLLRMENLNDVYKTMVQDIFGKNFNTELLSKNIGDTKNYSKFYKNVRSRLEVADDLTNKLKNTKFIKKFYNRK